ncbi:protein translocase subunit SecF [Candidatus Roizmanbacteria bacterium CG_4_10_14_0_8_um_filter_33_9]|uniref:Protein-export membrane protein SecF n=1 Tax=Candidatus Roizmanbacteria bacterium CG_4_10_14_0_8_um_filter_33_9 TaxID=1974826 RepID=A0A2M7QKK4_9BACT|nr:MAG: protein translocase subunit SecF [Candidatus Roizmanbacteria bacterium CG_4_10_14_0_8_um_filter_33_9]
MIRFSKWIWLYALISFVVIVSGLISILRYGFKYSIDFTGGTDITYSLSKNPGLDQVKNVFKENKIDVVNLKISQKVLEARTKPIDEKQELQLRNNLEKKLSLSIKSLRFDTVGPVLGKETLQKTLIASILATLGILLYMSFAFKGLNFAFAAILAMIHDFFVVIGTYSLLSYFFGAEVDTMFVTAVLTTMSFSVHDTIVIFDKIREYIKSEGKGNIEYLADKAVTETMVRSVNNSMTIVFMLLALTLLGGSTIRFFVAALLIGTITGTYSSPFIATPILIWLEKRKNK